MSDAAFLYGRRRLSFTELPKPAWRKIGPDVAYVPADVQTERVIDAMIAADLDVAEWARETVRELAAAAIAAMTVKPDEPAKGEILARALSRDSYWTGA